MVPQAVVRSVRMLSVRVSFGVRLDYCTVAGRTHLAKIALDPLDNSTIGPINENHPDSVLACVGTDVQTAIPVVMGHESWQKKGRWTKSLYLWIAPRLTMH